MSSEGSAVGFLRSGETPVCTVCAGSEAPHDEQRRGGGQARQSAFLPRRNKESVSSKGNKNYYVSDVPPLLPFMPLLIFRKTFFLLSFEF